MLHCLYCIALHCIALHCIATANALLCSRSVQLKQILDFSLGRLMRCNRDRCWHSTETGDGQRLEEALTKYSFHIIMKHIYHVLITKIYIG